MIRIYARLLLAITLIAAGFNSWAETEKPSVKTTALHGGLYLLQGRGGNVLASVGEDGVLLIDDDYAPYAMAYEQALADLVPGGAVPRFIINTHWHGDHVGNNGHWAQQGAVVLAHANVRARMSTRQDMKARGRVVEPSPAAALPVLTYGDSVALHFNGQAIEVQHFPRGHTDGDSVVFFVEQNLVHIGDHFFLDAFPFVDIDSGGNVDSYIANVAAVLARTDDNTVIVPGHGARAASRADLERFHQMLVATVAQVRAALAEGKTVEQISSQGLGEAWGSWGLGFIKEAAWIATIAAESDL